MRKLFSILIVVFLLFAVSGLVFAGGKDTQTLPPDGGGYFAKNSQHNQVLGGKSKNPKGLERAAERSNGVVKGNSGNETPK